MKNRSLIIRNGRVVDPVERRDEIADVFVVDGVISESPPTGEHAEIDASGKWVMPGLTDMHVHFREPGASDSETISTGLDAAWRGGFARVVTMPNTAPAVDTPDAVRFQMSLNESREVEVMPSACCTAGRAGRRVAELRELRKAGAVAFTDDGAMVADDDVMREAMAIARELGAAVMDHAVAPSIAGGGVIRDCATAREFGLEVFPPEAEIEAVRRDIALCRETGCRTHIQHLSTAGAVELIRAARDEGLPVSAEATPHHLLFSAEDIPGDDPAWKMNPPLGNPDDVAAIRAAVIDGTISCMATDHAPHSARLKAGGFAGSAFGVIGMEFAAGASMQALVAGLGMPPMEWAARWNNGPAEVLGIRPLSLAAGEFARVAIIAPEPYVADASMIASKSRNCPYIGRRLFGRPRRI